MKISEEVHYCIPRVRKGALVSKINCLMKNMIGEGILKEQMIESFRDKIAERAVPNPSKVMQSPVIGGEFLEKAKP